MIKIEQKKVIFNDFLAWIDGIQEDFPIPREICNVYFIVEFFQNDIVLSYSGDDKKLKIFDYGTYFPLEAEYFYSGELKELSKQIFESKKNLKTEIFEFLRDMVFIAVKKLKFLKAKSIFFGMRFKKVS